MNPYELKKTEEIISPSLIYYVDIIRKNIEKAIEKAGSPERLWPHVKSHKSLDLVKLQMEYGITKFKTATVAEAEMVAEAGAEQIILAYPLVGPNIGRYIKLAKAYPNSHFYAIGDDAGQLSGLSEACEREQIRMDVLVDVNMGMNRTGVSIEKLEALCRFAAELPGIRLAGLHCYDGSHEQDFEKRDADVLIGTQMISKGLNFDYVSVVGILNADSMLNYPDFRSYERAFQLMAQVAGRSGRKNKRGLVVLQTKSPELSLIHQVIANDYLGFYTEQLKERLLFKYPPFCRLIYVYLKHRKEEILDEAATFMATLLKNGLSGRVLGPDYPPVSRIQTYYIKKIILKIEKQLSMEKVKMFLLQVQQNTLLNERFHSLVVYYDVDPM